MATSLFNQYYSGDINKIRQQYEENLAQPSQVNVQQSQVDTGEITGLLDQIIERYKIGGEFGKAELALLNRAKTKSLASTMQGMVSAGLAGTTVPTGAGKKWEEEIGMPSRLRLEDIRTERLTGAMGAKAGFMERAGAREEQFNLQKEQLLLQERLRNREISLQEYLSEMNRLSRLSTSGGGGGGGTQPSTLPEGFGEFSPGMESWSERQQRLAGGSTGTVYPSLGGDFSGGGGGTLGTGTMTSQYEYPKGGALGPYTPGTYGEDSRLPTMQSLADMAQKWLGEEEDPSKGTFVPWDPSSGNPQAGDIINKWYRG